MANLWVSIKWIDFKNPITISSSPLTSNIDGPKKAEECGAAEVSINHTLLE